MILKGTLLLLAMAFSLPAVSQYKNILLDEWPGGQPSVSGPTIAINPRNPDNRVAAAVPDKVYYTNDGGQTWTKQKISSAFGLCGEPVLIADRKGAFYYLHPSDPTLGQGGYETEKLDRIVIQKSDDGGVSWSPGESIGLNHPKDQRQQRATIDDKGNLFVTWTQFDRYGNADGQCTSNVLFSMSKNGKKWSDPVVISELAGNCTGDDSTPEGAVPAVTPEGKVMIAWSSQGKIFMDRSFNGGERWLSRDIEVTVQEGGSNLPIPGHGGCNATPVLLTDNSKSRFRGSLYITWADQRKGEDDTDIWFTRSHNFGDNWASPMRINDDGKGKHQYMPWMTVDDETGYLYIVYYDRRDHDDLQTDVYLAYSTDGGSSFKNVRISEKSFTPDGALLLGDAIDIAAHDGIIAPIWTRTDEGKTSLWTAIIKHEDLERK